MRGEVSEVGRFQRLSGYALRTALDRGNCTGSVAGKFEVTRLERIGALACKRTVVVHDGERSLALKRCPRIVGHNRNAAGNLDNVDYAFDLFGLGCVERRYFCAEDRRIEHRGELHARHADIDPVLRRAVDLQRRVDAPIHFADQRELVGSFQRRFGRSRNRRGCADEAAIRRSAIVLGIHHGAALGSERRRVDAPLLRGRGNQHRARTCAGSAQRHPHRCGTRAAAGDLQMETRISIHGRSGSKFDEDIFHRNVELVCNDRRHAGCDALTHLGFIDEDRHLLVGMYDQPRIGFESSRLRRALTLIRTAACAHAEHEAAGKHRSETNEIRAINRGHDVCPPVACATALRIRPYVPHRQMLVIDEARSASVGCGLVLSKPEIAINWPD